MTAKKIDSDAICAWIERQKAKGRENRDPARFSNEINIPAESWVDLFKCYLINSNGDAYELVHLENKISAEGARYVAIKAFRYRQNAAGRWCFGGFVELTGLDGLMEWADDDDALMPYAIKSVCIVCEALAITTTALIVWQKFC